MAESSPTVATVAGGTDLHELLGYLPGRTLGEVVEGAALLTRTDRKYLLPIAEVREVLGGLAEGLAVLDLDGRRSSAYESTYFDTHDLVTYHLAARRRPARFKVRTRTYLDDQRSLLEVKVRSRRGQNIKHQHPVAFEDRGRLSADALDLLRANDHVRPHASELGAVLRTSYRRSTLLVPGQEARVTVDLGLAADDLVRGASLQRPLLAVVETKTAGAPCLVDRELWRRGHRPAKVSKFATSLAALRPELPANVWHRTLTGPFAA